MDDQDISGTRLKPEATRKQPGKAEVIALPESSNRTLLLEQSKRTLFFRWLRGTNSRDLASAYKLPRFTIEDLLRAEVLRERLQRSGHHNDSGVMRRIA